MPSGPELGWRPTLAIGKMQVQSRRRSRYVGPKQWRGPVAANLQGDAMLEELVRSSEPVTAPTALAPGRAKTGRPHPQELRSHVITAVLAGASYREAAAQYGVSVTAAFTWAKRFRQTGSMVAKPMGGDRRSRLKSERDWPAAARLGGSQSHVSSTARGASRTRYLGRLPHAAEIPQEGEYRSRKRARR